MISFRSLFSLFLSRPPRPSKAELNAIKAVLGQWAAAINDGDVNRLLGLLTEDAVIRPPQMQPFSGKQAFESLYRSAFKEFAVQESISPEEIRVAGNVASIRVQERFTLTPRAGGDPIHHGLGLKGIVRLRRQADHSWKIAGPSFASTSYLASRLPPERGE